jgi:hypothetical protein
MASSHTLDLDIAFDDTTLWQRRAAATGRAGAAAGHRAGRPTWATGPARTGPAAS